MECMELALYKGDSGERVSQLSFLLAEQFTFRELWEPQCFWEIVSLLTILLFSYSQLFIFPSIVIVLFQINTITVLHFCLYISLLTFRSGFNPTHKDIPRSANLGWSNPTHKTGSIGSNSNSTSSVNSTGKKIDNDRRGGANERWKGMRNEEMEERRAKGLCFRCGGKYHPTLHKCPERSLRVLILGEGESVNEDGEIVAMEMEEVEEEEGIEAECKVIGVLGKMGEYRTMKIEGKLEKVNVEVLIDSGASHSFISPELIIALGLTVTPPPM